MSAKKLPDGEFLSKELTIVNKLGIHARPAALFVKTANRFACEIFVEKDGEKINGKSIMGLMMLAARARQQNDPARSRRGRPASHRRNRSPRQTEV